MAAISTSLQRSATVWALESGVVAKLSAGDRSNFPKSINPLRRCGTPTMVGFCGWSETNWWN
jgi:hypothetical protein